MAVSNSRLSRRALLRKAAWLAQGAIAAAVWSPARARPGARTRLLDYPFKLGVASGDPLADGFLIWTRLAPDPLHGGGMPDEDVPVQWEVAKDSRMRAVVRAGVVAARPALAHSVHVDVQGLEPDRPYWYRFAAGGEQSTIGRTRTFPIQGSPKERMRLAWASCQHFGHGYFSAYQHMVEGDPDLVLHLGDYVYESAWGPRVRFHVPEPYTLTEYRDLHALYKTDIHLQRAHAHCPWAVTWDDHEVDNDYAGLFDQAHLEPQDAFVARRAAAYKAYYEHMPLRLNAVPRNGRMQLYTSLQFGDLATIAVLDNRQYRSDQACADESARRALGGNTVIDCAERLDPERSMLGRTQERWLHGLLRHSPSRWRVIAQQQLMAEIDQDAGAQGKDIRWSDGWDGYAATRARLLRTVAKRGIENVVVLGGDIHQFWVTDLKSDSADESSPVLATEFVGTSITSGSSDWAVKYLPRNPHVRFHAWEHRGYARAELSHREWRTEFVAVNDVLDPQAGASVLKRFVVESGRPGAEEV